MFIYAIYKCNIIHIYIYINYTYSTLYACSIRYTLFMFHPKYIYICTHTPMKWLDSCRVCSVSSSNYGNCESVIPSSAQIVHDRQKHTVWLPVWHGLKG